MPTVQLLTPSEAKAALPGFLDQNPDYLAKPDWFAAFKRTLIEIIGMNAIDFAITVNAYIASKAAPPAPAAVMLIDIEHLKAIEHTGCLPAILNRDHSGNITHHLQTDQSGDFEALLLAMELDHAPELSVALGRDGMEQLTEMLIKNPTARDDITLFNMLNGNDVDPGRFPSPERLECFRYLSGRKTLPAGWTIGGNPQTVYDATGKAIA